MKQKIKTWIRKNKWNIMIWGVILFNLLFYVLLMFARSVWTDEAFTLYLIAENYEGITKGTIRDVHPPLYYYIIKPITYIFGKNLIMLKAMSILPVILTFCMLKKHLSKEFGEKAALLTILFLGAFPRIMIFAVQIRMYTWALLFVTGTAIYAYHCFKESKFKNWVFLVLFSVASAYTHYFAFVAIISVNGFLFLTLLIRKRNQIKWFALSIVSMFILYIPWMPYFIKQVTRVRAGYWIPEITDEIILDCYTWLFKLDLCVFVKYVFFVFIGVSLILIVKNIIQKKGNPIISIICILIPIMTIETGILLSLQKAPIYRNQYIFPAIALIALFFGISLRHLRKATIAIITIILMVLTTLQFKDAYFKEYEMYKTEKTLDYLEENIGEYDCIIYNWERFDFIYKEQFPGIEQYYIGMFDFSLCYYNMWFMSTKNQPMISEDILDKYDLKLELIGAYGIEHNDFDLYRIYK